MTDVSKTMDKIARAIMTTKPVKNIKITKDGKVKKKTVYRDKSAAIRAKKSKTQRVVRKTI